MAPDVVVGPWCLIEGAVTLGPGCRLLERVSLRGPLIVGGGNHFYPQASLGLEPQDRKFDPAKGDSGIVIGDGNLFREGVTIHRATGATPTTIGNRNYFMANSHAGHDVKIGNDCTLANGALLGGHVQLGDGVLLGGNSSVHQFCRIGRLGMLSGQAAISQDLPPFCTVYNTRMIGSLNFVGLRRNGYRQEIDALRRVFEIYYLEHHTGPVALEIIERELGDNALAREFVQFVRTSRRGMTSYGLTKGLPEVRLCSLSLRERVAGTPAG